MNKTRKTQLTEKQLRNSLSAKKKPQKPSLKNVLCQPFPRFWPEIQSNEADILANLFNGINDLASAGEEEANHNEKSSTFIKYGLNSSLHLLQQRDKSVDVLLISANIKPKFIVDQIILLAFANNPNIKILCVPDMDVVFRKVVKFSCLCLILMGIESGSPYRTTAFPIIERMCSKFPSPKIHQNLITRQGKCLEKSLDNLIDDTVMHEMPEIDFDQLYIRKNPSGERAFIPNKVCAARNQNLDFISFNEKMETEDSDMDSSTIANSNEIIGSNGAPVKLKKSIEKAKAKLQNLVILKENARIEKKHKKKKNKNKKLNELSKTINNAKGQKSLNYISLGVNKIQGNPKKVKKNKKKKNK